MKQNKKPKQTLESAQYGLEINFKERLPDEGYSTLVRKFGKRSGLSHREQF